MRKSLWVLSALLLLIAASAPGARADDFTVSFTNTIGNVPGTVVVDITGLTNNTTGAAASVIILSHPTALNPQIADAGTTATLWTFQDANQFTETAGSLVFADFVASTIVDGTVAAIALDSSSTVVGIECPQNEHTALLGYGPLFSCGGTPVLGVQTTFALAPATAPEPSSVALMLAGIGFLVVMGKRLGQGLP
jgi:hypothetical protein